jgi:hypothetical protein
VQANLQHLLNASQILGDRSVTNAAAGFNSPGTLHLLQIRESGIVIRESTPLT